MPLSEKFRPASGFSSLPADMLRLARGVSPVHRSRRRPVGTVPGTLHGETSSTPPVMDVIAWSEASGAEAFVASDVAEAYARMEGGQFVWLNIRGNAHRDTLSAVAQAFGLHPLAVEDAWTVSQRSKVALYSDHLFLVLDQLCLGSNDEVRTQQLSLFLGERFLITVQENEEEVFGPIRARLLDSRGQMQRRGPDYVAYALSDVVVDACFPVVDAFADRVEAMEAVVSMRRRRGVIEDLLVVRQQVHELNRWSRPVQRALSELLATETPILRRQTRTYFRDCLENARRVGEAVDGIQEHAKNLLDIYIALASHEMNEVMKVLTIISTIFIPLSFIAGVYGMNFDPDVSPWNMPELNWVFGYPFALVLMAAVATGFGFYFRMRRWW